MSLWRNKTVELREELRNVLKGRIRWLDVLLPSLLFLLIYRLVGFEVALLGAVGGIGGIAIYRLSKGQSLRFVFGGALGVIASAGIAFLTGNAEGFFLPGLISTIVSATVCFLSVILRRPLVAWTSYLVRRWPLDWYWHPKVRPAYTEVSLGWGLFFSLRAWLQFALFQRSAATTLGLAQILSGWPAMILLLIASYLYGLWRLQNLRGPSVEEYSSGRKPPWLGQKRGF